MDWTRDEINTLLEIKKNGCGGGLCEMCPVMKVKSGIDRWHIPYDCKPVAKEILEKEIFGEEECDTQKSK